MLSVDKLSENFSDEKLALKKNFKVVTICENMMPLHKIYIRAPVHSILSRFNPDI